MCVPDDTTACGDGTMLVDGECVPDATCGAGTTLTDGECLPDGSIICDQGTMFDASTGQCVVDPSACASGTVLIGDECVPEDDTLTADLEEAAEPNEMSGAGSFDVPALNAQTTLHGCITPKTDGTADQDVWLINASGPALLEITADGVGGLAAGFIMFAYQLDELSNYSRYGINLVGDTSKRQVYLPLAGTYLLVMDDSRALLTGEAAGDANTCYYTTVEHIPMPSATTATLPQTMGSDSGDIAVYSHTASAVGDILDVTQTTATGSLRPAFILLKDGAFHDSAAFDAQTGAPVVSTVGGLEAAEQIDVIVDNVYNLALTPQDYTLDIYAIGAQPLPTDGSQITHTKHNDDTPNAPYVDDNYSFLDVTAGEVIHIDLTSSVAVSMNIVRADIFDGAGSLDTVAPMGTRTDIAGQFVRFRDAGRYYLITRDASGTSGDTYTITSTLEGITPGALTYDSTESNQALPTSGSGFHTIDLTGQDWIQVGVSGSSWGNDVRVSLYDLDGEGWLSSSSGSAGANYVSIQSGVQASDGTEPLGRITSGDARDFLVRIEDTGTSGGSPTYDLLIDERPHVLIGALMPNVPVVRTNMDPTAAGELTRYLAMGAAGNRLVAEVTPTNGAVDIQVHRRTADELIPGVGGTFDSAGAGGTETLSGIFSTTPDWIAFTVTNAGSSSTNLSLTLTATEPLPFVDICPNGTIFPAPHDGTADDEYTAIQTLPNGLDFEFFGVTQTDFIVAANGLIAFGTTNPSCSFGCYSNGTIPSTSQPNGIIAGYWDDLENIQLCRQDDADKVTIQWTGDLYGISTDVVQFQVVLNSSGQIDIIYGPNHEATGSSATVGAEDPTGTSGIQIFRNAPDGAAPSSSYSFTTAP